MLTIPVSTTVELPTILPAIIAAFAALGAALVAFVAAKINANTAKENAALQAKMAQAVKISEYRQAWINSLRENFVTFVSIAGHNRIDSTDRLVESAIRIRLLMNPIDRDFDELLKTIGVLIKQLSEENKASSSNSPSYDFVVVAQRILKREWDVLKDELRRIDHNN